MLPMGNALAHTHTRTHTIGHGWRLDSLAGSIHAVRTAPSLTGWFIQETSSPVDRANQPIILWELTFLLCLAHWHGCFHKTLARFLLLTLKWKKKNELKRQTLVHNSFQHLEAVMFNFQLYFFAICLPPYQPCLTCASVFSIGTEQLVPPSSIQMRLQNMSIVHTDASVGVFS